MPPTRPIPITLDAGPAVHQSAGLSRYATRLIEHLWREQRERVALTLFYNAHSGHALPPTLGEIPTRTVNQGQYRWRLGALASQRLGTPNYAKAILPPQNGSILYHATEHLLPRLPCPTVLTVHDLIFERYPEHHTATNRAFLKQAMPTFVRAATHIIAVSEQTKRDLMELYATPAGKITVVYEGIDAGFSPAAPDAVERIRGIYSPERPYLLMVGTLEPRKNHLAAVRALARLKAAGRPHRLLIAGGQGWLFDEIRRQIDSLGLQDDVRFTGYVPDAELPALYSGAACLLLPSLYEGFGFPVLEAMACGTPVVCANVSSLPEIAGDAALLVPPTDDEALAAAVAQILTEPELAVNLVRAGFEQAGRFSWSRCAEQTVAVYEGVLHGI
jgi:glycosyltransferase involved in cell wall biosynthesis